MKTWKRALALVLALVMALSLVALPSFAEGEEKDTYSVVINYVFADGSQAAPSWTATLARGSDYHNTVTSPTVVGYEPNKTAVELNISSINADVTETVTYKPAEVSFTVKHYQQNTDNDNYTLAYTETRTGYTESVVGAGLAKTYEGFTALLYDTTTKIAADGSTEVEIYYDRNYYLLSLDLDGGWGADPIYARYGAVIGLSSPTKPGYTFAGWDPKAPANMPAENQTLKAQWTASNVEYRVQYWQENANDSKYSYVESQTVTAKAGDVVSGETYEYSKSYNGFTYDHADTNVTVAGDGSTVVNVYFNRNLYTVTFKNGQQILTCGKEEHSHTYTGSYKEGGVFGIGATTYYYGGCYPAGSNGSGGATKGNTICGKEEHTHSSRCYTTSDLTITAKYGAFIGDQWPGNGWYVDTDMNTFQSYLAIMPLGGKTFYGQLSGSGTATATYYVEVLPDESGTTVGGRTYKQHHQDTPKSPRATITDEERYDLEGFTCNTSISAKNGSSLNGAKFYYTRNSYTLVYNDQYGTTKEEQLPYEQVLSKSVNKSYVPAYPKGLEAGAYEFAGWYLDPEGTQSVDWNAKMPAAKVVLYAKWAPKTHTVRTFLTEEAMNAATAPIDTWENVPHRSTINKPENPINGKYTFVGWFYQENGVEKAFDFSMAVTKNLNLYAKWSSNTLVEYTIHYRLADGTTIAPDTTGSALAGATKTFDAKTGTDLNQGYQIGYFPKVGSHSITMNIDGDNVFTFVYVPGEKVNYTVRYLEKDTNNVLHEEKHAATRDAVITEKFVTITGYAPDAYQKRLVLSADEGSNVITFWYVKDTEHAPVQIIHWVQNIAGDGYTEYSSSTNLNGLIGETYTAEWLTIAGFAKNETKSNISGVLTNQGLVLNLYYDRIEYPYEFRFVNSYTGEEITGYDFGTTNGNARFGDRVTYTAPERLGALGYKLDTAKSSASQAIDIRIEDPANVAKLNVKTFYYIPYFNVVHVQRDPATENVTRTPNEVDLTVSIAENGYDLTAQVAAGYLYGGSFSNEACTEVQGYGTENPTSFTPTRGQTYYIWEVPDTYLRPSNYRVARHIDGVQTLCKLYPLTTADRLLYKEVGFSAYFGNDTASVVDIKSGSNNAEFEPPVANPGAATVYQMVKAARNGKVETTVYVMDGKLSSVNADITDGTANGKPIDPGYIGGARLTDDQFAQFKTDGITYTPYWITLDGVKVTGTMQRNLTFDASKPNVAQIKKIPVATTCTYVEDTPAVRLLNFATAFNMDDSQTTVDTRITVTVQDGASTYTTKVQPGDPVELTPNGQDGKLFAGWYVDGKASDLSGFTADTTVVAKYVDGSYLDLDYSRIGLFRVRGVTLISAVDDEDNYQEVGIMVNGEPVSSVRFASRYMLFNTPSSMFGVARGSRFVIADQSLYGSGALEVTPYWITMDGTTVLGQSHTLHYTSRSIWE